MVKFQLKDASRAIVQAGSLITFSASTDSGDTGATFRWDSTNQQYIYNYKTARSHAGMCQAINATLDDGTTHSVTVGCK